jgi:hypothetical protein
MGDFQALIKPALNVSSNIFVIRPMSSDDQVLFEFQLKNYRFIEYF